MTYSEDRRRKSDKFIPTIQRIVGPYLLVPTTPEIDMNQNADLIVLMARDMRIAARVRNPGFVEDFNHQFTLRSTAGNGHKTEMQKVHDGWGDWMFYGHCVAEGSLCIAPWWLMDLGSFRAHVIEHNAGRHHLTFGEGKNPDGSKFHWFDIRSFVGEPELLIGACGDGKQVGEVTAK